MVSSTDFLRASERTTAIAPLNRQRHLTPSCGGFTPTAERTVGPARISLESLTPRPEIREHYRHLTDVGPMAVDVRCRVGVRYPVVAFARTESGSRSSAQRAAPAVPGPQDAAQLLSQTHRARISHGNGQERKPAPQQSCLHLRGPSRNVLASYRSWHPSRFFLVCDFRDSLVSSTPLQFRALPQCALKVRPARSFRRLRNAGPISAPGVQMPPSPCTSRTRQRALSAIILLVEP